MMGSLSKQQIQAGQQENQVRGMQLQDMQTIRGLAPKFVQKDANGNLTGYDYEGLAKASAAAGVNPQTVQQMQVQHAEAVEKLTGADKAVRDNEQDKNKLLYETLEGIKSVKDPAQQQQAYMQGVQKVGKAGIDVSKLPAQFPGNDALSAFEAQLGMHAQVIADSKGAIRDGKNNTEALLNQNKLHVINSWKQNPQQVLSQVDSIVPGPVCYGLWRRGRRKSRHQAGGGASGSSGERCSGSHLIPPSGRKATFSRRGESSRPRSSAGVLEARFNVTTGRDSLK
jgi:hypothetical protein